MMTKPFDVLDKNQKIFGNYFIEASAGTGKTFTIAHLVLRLLLQSTPPISVKKMGIVTFTKAAASELKKRIKELLKETKDRLENNLPIKIFGLDLDHKEALYRIKMALTEIDSAPISTLHGLCFHILKKNFLNFNNKIFLNKFSFLIVGRKTKTYSTVYAFPLFLIYRILFANIPLFLLDFPAI
jgi:ATP-dependent exoDNAse (exonuclease V) beta subunit